MKLIFEDIILDIDFKIEKAEYDNYFVSSINSEFEDKYSLIHISKNVDFSLINC